MRGQGQREVGMLCVQYIYIQRTTVQSGEPSILLMTTSYARKPGKMVFFGSERKIYHAREDAIKPRWRLQVPSVPHTGTIPHHAVRSSRQSMRFTPCLLVISASPGIRLHR